MSRFLVLVFYLESNIKFDFINLNWVKVVILVMKIDLLLYLYCFKGFFFFSFMLKVIFK